MSDRGHGGKTFLNREYPIADAGIYRIEGDDDVTCRLIGKVERLEEQNLLAFVSRLLLRGDDISHDASDDHGRRLCTSSTMATIVASVGTSFGLKAKAASRPRQT